MVHSTVVFVGIDVSKARHAVTVADGERGGEVRFLGEVDASEESMRRLVNRLAAKHERMHFCYEAEPTGYGGDRVKTNRRDAVALAKLLRAGELTPVWVPGEGHE